MKVLLSLILHLLTSVFRVSPQLQPISPETFAQTEIATISPAILPKLSTVEQNTTAIEKLGFAANLSSSSILRLQTIADCESTFRQFNHDGTLYLGEVNPLDVGIFQINTYYSPQKTVKAVTGFDIETLEGNINYAILLYKKNGSQPWYLSEPCWSKKTAP